MTSIESAVREADLEGAYRLQLLLDSLLRNERFLGQEPPREAKALPPPPMNLDDVLVGLIGAESLKLDEIEKRVRASGYRTKSWNLRRLVIQRLCGSIRFRRMACEIYTLAETDEPSTNRANCAEDRTAHSRMDGPHAAGSAGINGAAEKD